MPAYADVRRICRAHEIPEGDQGVVITRHKIAPHQKFSQLPGLCSADAATINAHKLLSIQQVHI